MLYKEYGKTGKMVSAIGCGGMRFNEEEYRSGDLTKCAEVVKAAYDAGINYFDTAPGYNHDKSEDIFGLAFQEMKGKPFYVSTKCGLWTAKDGDDARRLLEKSLTRLGVPKINFYHLWCMKTMDDYRAFMRRGGIYEGIKKAQEEGLVEHITFSTHMNSADIRTVVETGLFEGVTLGYNAVNFAFRQGGVDAAYENGLGVVVMNPLGGGMIPGNPDYFSFLRQGEDSLTVSALKFITSQPQTTVALCGFTTVEQVAESVKAAENLYRVDEAFRAELAKKLSSDLNTMCTTCGYCDECPAGIPIPKFMESYNYFILSGGKDKSVLDRLDAHWDLTNGQAASCVRCGKCESLCTQKLPIMERLAAIAAMKA